MKLSKLYIILLCSVILVSCHWAETDKSNGGKDVAITVVRYDKLLNEYVEFNSFLAWKKMNTDYHRETKYLIEDVLKLGQVNDSHIYEKLKAYYADSTLKTLTKDALVKFRDVNDIEKKLTRGFKRLKQEIPSIKVPCVYSQISALNESVVVGDSLLGFSIDKYMGEDYPLYKRYFYDYQCRSMNPDRIVPDCFMFYLLSDYPFPEVNEHTLLDCIMHRGKIHYVSKVIQDNNSYGKELGFTEAEDEWCMQNRDKIWKYMVQNKHLASTDPMVIRKYTAPAPYTAYFGEGSPAMIGVWIGVQIIDSYMKNNKNVTIEELMKTTDYQRMLADAGFKP